MNIYKYLKKKNKRNPRLTKEYKFFEENKKTISKIKSFYNISDSNPEFVMLKNNILIKSIQTKETIHQLINENSSLSEEEQKEKIQEYLKTRPFFQTKNENIYLPQYSKALNFLYVNSPKALKKYPYIRLEEEAEFSCIDFFDEYGYKIFNSSFTDLQFIIEDKTSAAFYSDDLEMIFVINDQGTLDVAIYLFDKYMSKKNKYNMPQRCLNVMKKFYSNNRIDFILSLREEKLISSKMKAKMLKKVQKRVLKQEKKHEVKHEKV